MIQYLIMCRSLTYAQKASKALERSGITASIVKAPQALSTGGCAYAVSIRNRINDSIVILKRYDIPTGKIFARSSDGNYSEVQL